MKKTIVLVMGMVLALSLSLSVTGCDTGGGSKPEPEKPEQPIPKTYTITLRDGALVFTVEYTDLPSVEPAYLTYLKTRLELMANQGAETPEAAAVNNLINNGGANQTIIVEYTGTSYSGIKWNATTRKFTVHNTWISTASGTDLRAGDMRNAFNSVEPEGPQRQFTVTLLDKTVTVIDARTGASDQTLEQLGVMTKLREAVTLINNNTNMTTETRAAFDRVLAKGMVIEFDSPATISQTYRAKGDGKTMIIDVNYASNSASTSNILGGFIILAVRDYLDTNTAKES
jgi:hypothetical protein